MPTLFKKAVVEKRNVLNELRCCNMTVQELRFFSIYLSKIDHRDISTRFVKFPMEDFQRIMGFDKLNMEYLRMSIKRLIGKEVSIPDENGRGFRAFPLFNDCHVYQDTDNQWYVEINAHDRALPIMFDFKDEYVKYELWNVLRLNGRNQFRMYEILKQYLKIGYREVEVSELYELLGVQPGKYNRWDNFRRKVLDECQEILKKETDIYYTYERGKTGKGGKWISVIFHIYKNADYNDPLSLDEFIDLQCDEKSECQQIEIIEKPLASACNDEFDEDEMNMIESFIDQKKLPDEDKYDYLKKMYSKMKAYAAKNEIKNPCLYLCKMIQNDEVDKPGTDPDVEKYKVLINKF